MVRCFFFPSHHSFCLHKNSAHPCSSISTPPHLPPHFTNCSRTVACTLGCDHCLHTCAHNPLLSSFIIRTAPTADAASTNRQQNATSPHAPTQSQSQNSWLVAQVRRALTMHHHCTFCGKQTSDLVHFLRCCASERARSSLRVRCKLTSHLLFSQADPAKERQMQNGCHATDRGRLREARVSL